MGRVADKEDPTDPKLFGHDPLVLPVADRLDVRLEVGDSEPAAQKRHHLVWWGLSAEALNTDQPLGGLIRPPVGPKSPDRRLA